LGRPKAGRFLFIYLVLACTAGDIRVMRGRQTNGLAGVGAHVHLVGICGVGMAGLAGLLKRRGFEVNGCDRARNRLADWLEGQGIEVREGHDPGHITQGVDWVIHSAAVSENSPELAKARESGLRVLRRGEVLPRLLVGRKSVAVCGTHGKTTTAWMITQVLWHCGKSVSWCIGGELAAEDTGRASGYKGGAPGDNDLLSDEDTVVVEADESDGTLAFYRPDIAVITNIEFDHMEYFGSRDAFEECFRRLVNNTRRGVVFCADDPVAAAVCAGRDGALSFGFEDGCRVQAHEVDEAAAGIRFELAVDGQDRGTVELGIPGRHNVLNALAAIAAGRLLGLGVREILPGLAGARLPRRRFEKTVDEEGLVVISDYAHHPSEIAALVRTARGLNRRRVLAVFQPHRYTRTLALGHDFPAAFRGVDRLVLAPVYAASEDPLRGGTVWDLYRHFRPGARGPCETGAGLPLVAGSLEEAWRWLKRELREGDLLLVVGAGDVDSIAQRAAAEWAVRESGSLEVWETGPNREGVSGSGCGSGEAYLFGSWQSAALDELRELAAGSVFSCNEPLAEKTTLKVGGPADLWYEIDSPEDLKAILRWSSGHGVRFQVLGGGSNVLVSDLGVRGMVGRLSGAAFRRIEERDGMAVAGAGASLAGLVAWSQKAGRGGLEFLEGIPGTVGGAVRMNAGAQEKNVGEHLSWIRCLNLDGGECMLRESEFGTGYRICNGVRDRIVLEAAFRVVPEEPAVIEEKRRKIAARRKWMKGVRSAGSVFLNPPGGYAGRLLEAAGAKGLEVGGAAVSERHANFIVTGPGATAADVRALLELLRAEVRAKFGIQLRAEVGFIG